MRKSHPTNIVELYDVGETETGEPFLVLQRLSGQTLADFLNARRRLEPRIAARIGRDIANALVAAHAGKIVHRDLKPANVFLHRDEGLPDGEFVVKVLDFGVSKDLNALDGPVTVTGMPVGSPAYMSPEQVSASKDIDTRTDIWSLGIVLYELVVGVRPFTGIVQDVVRHILVTPAERISSRIRNVPPGLDDVVARCLERDRAKRLQSAEEVARMLGALVESSAPKNTSDQIIQIENISPDSLKRISAEVLSLSVPNLVPITSQAVVAGVETFALVPSSNGMKNELPFQVNTQEDGARTAILLERQDPVIVEEILPVTRRERRQTITPDLGWIKASLGLGVAATGVLCLLTLSSLSNPVDARIPVKPAAIAAQVPTAMVPPPNELPVVPPRENTRVNMPVITTSTNAPSDIASAEAKETPSASAIATSDVRKPAPKKVFIKPR